MKAWLLAFAVLSVTLFSFGRSEILLTGRYDVWLCNPNVSTSFPSASASFFNCTNTSGTTGNVTCLDNINNCTSWQVTPDTVLNFTIGAPNISLYCCGLCASSTCYVGSENYRSAYNDTVCSGSLSTSNYGASWNCTDSTCATTNLVVNPATNNTWICSQPNCTGTSSYNLDGDIWRCQDPNCLSDLSFNSTSNDFICYNVYCSDLLGTMVRTNTSGNLSFTCQNATCASMTYNPNTTAWSCNVSGSGSHLIIIIVVVVLIVAVVYLGRRHMLKQQLQQELQQNLQKA